MLCTIERKRNNIRNIFNIRKQFNTFWIWLYWIWFRWDITGWVLWHRLCICFGVNDWVRRTHIKSLYVYAYDAMRSSLCACVIFLSFLLAVTAHTMLIHILLNGEQLTTFLWAIRLASMTFLLYNKVTAQYYTLYKICACSMERVLLIIFFSLSHWFDDTVLNTQKQTHRIVSHRTHSIFDYCFLFICWFYFCSLIHIFELTQMKKNAIKLSN